MTKRYGKRGRGKYKSIVEISKPDWFCDLMDSPYTTGQTIRLMGPINIVIDRDIVCRRRIEIHESFSVTGGSGRVNKIDYTGDNIFECESES